MRIVTQKQFGDPSVLELAEVDKPVPGYGQVLVKVAAAGVNFVDTVVRAQSLFGLQVPLTLGWDVAGTVEAVAPGISQFAPGDAVLALVGFPALGNTAAEYVLVGENELARKPDGWSFAEAGALPLAGLTAWQALVGIADVRPGQRVLVHRAAGGVGHLAVQLAKARGAHVIGTASAGKHALLKELGADELIDYTTQDYTDLKDVDVVVDLLGGEHAERSAATLRPGGLLLGFVGYDLGFSPERAAELGIRFEVVSVRPSAHDLRALTGTPGVRPVVQAEVPLADAARAHELIASGRTTGKIVLVP
ncbi:NADP-dependent oxidoreductase [Actinocorallia lasiicapitis]